jgi:dienelactone hydrolase
MSDPLRLARYREPLGLAVRQGSRIAATPDLRIQEMEFSSRGDRVTGCVVLPAEGGGPHPLLLVQHAIGGSAADWIEPAAIAWAPAGAVVAAIDFPLHGKRADRKLLRWLLAEDVERSDPRRGALAVEFARQCVIDAERALDALTSLAWIDPERIAYLGFGLGAQVGSAFCALDPRPAAVVLAPGRDVLVAGELDPRENTRRIAPRPTLWLRGPGDADGTPESPSAEVVAVEGGTDPGSTAAVAAIGAFLSRTLAF